MFTMKHVRKSDGVTHVFSCDSYEKLPVDDLGREIPQLIVQGERGNAKVILNYGDLVYIENIKGKTIDVVKAPLA